MHDPGAGAASFLARPAFALLGVAVGTIVAVLLVPQTGYYGAHALLPSGIAMTLGLLAGPVLSGMRNPLTAFRTEHLLMLGLVYWILLDAIQGSHRLWDVSQDTVERVFLYTGVFAGCLWLGSSLTTLFLSPRRAARELPDVGPAFLFRAGLVCFVFGYAQAFFTCRFSLECVIDSFSAPRFEVPWFSGPGLKGLNTVLANLRYFGFLTLPLAVALFIVQRRLDWRVAVLTVLSALFLLLLMRDGGRKDLGTVAGAAMLVWVLLQPHARIRHFGAVLGGAALLLVVMQTMLTWRDVGVTKALDGGTPQKTYPGIAVDWGLDWMAHVIEVVPQRAPHTGWTGVVYIVGYPIPRSVWPTKPIQRGIDLPRYIGRQYPHGFSWNCTAVGDFYLIGGVAMVAFGGLLYGFASNCASRLLFRRRSVRSRLLYAAVAMTLFLSLRAVWELTAQGMTVAAVWALLAVHLPGKDASRRVDQLA